MLRTSAVSFAALLAVAFAGAGTAREPTSPDAAGLGTPTFNSYDADRDGKITRIESSTNVTLIGQFERLDRNENDVLERAEFARFEAEMDRGRDAGPPEPGESPVRPFPDRPGPPPPQP